MHWTIPCLSSRKASKRRARFYIPISPLLRCDKHTHGYEVATKEGNSCSDFSRMCLPPMECPTVTPAAPRDFFLNGPMLNLQLLLFAHNMFFISSFFSSQHSS